MKRAVLIAGPTASGKSQAAMAVAEAVGGVVVNADSMQVYRELRLLSARPGPEDEARVPHLLFGHVPACDAYSTGRWLEDVSAAVKGIEQEGRVPVIVGGTGLYFRALQEGLADIPQTPDKVRRAWRQRLEEVGPERLHAELAACDPALAGRLEPGDGQRIVRGLEVLEATGRRLSDWQAQSDTGAVYSEADTVRMVIEPVREELYERCDARFDRMIELGALDEVCGLLELGLDADLPVMKALGVRQLAAHLNGDCDLATAISDAKTWTRRYAKRQLTWLRRNMISWNLVDVKDSETNMAYIFAILRENELTPSG